MKLILSSLLLLSVCTGKSFGDDPVSALRPVADLIDSLRHSDEQVRTTASTALCEMGPAVVPALARSLKRPNVVLQREIAFMLGRMGSDGKAAVPELVELLDHESPDVQSFAAFALGKIGPDATAAIPALVKMSHSAEAKLSKSAAQALSQIRAERKQVIQAKREQSAASDAEFLDTPKPPMRDGTEKKIHANEKEKGVADVDEPDSTADEELEFEFTEPKDTSSTFEMDPADPQGRHILDEVSRDPGHVQVDLQTQAAAETTVVSPQPGASQRPAPGVRHPELAIPSIDPEHSRAALAVVVAWFVFWPLCWSVLLWVRPLWLLSLNDSLTRFLDLRLPRFLGAGRISLRNLFVLKPFHYRQRVLDAWLEKHAAAAVATFWKRDAAREHRTYVPLPVVVNESTVPTLAPEQLRPTFSSHAAYVLISGESGTGKTCLACQFAQWGLDKRLSGHVMLPVLIQGDSDRPLIDVISDQIASLVGGQEFLPPEMMKSLIEHRRILAIVDPVSGEPDETQAIVQEIRDIVADAVVVASSSDEMPQLDLKLRLQPVRLSGDHLSSFVAGYLAVRDKRSLFSDVEYFDACRALSALGRDTGRRRGLAPAPSDSVSRPGKERRTTRPAVPPPAGETPNEGLSVLIARLFVEQMIFTKERYGTPNLPGNIPSLMLQHLHVVNQNKGVAAVDDRTVQNDIQRIARLCLSRRLRPAAVSRNTVLRELEGSRAAKRLGYLQDTLGLVEQLPGQEDRIRIGLNPLAEYLAGAHLVFTFKGNEHRWTTYLSQVERMPRGSQAIKSYLLAVLDCCLAFGPGVPDWVPAKLGRFAGLDSEHLKREMLSKRVHRAVDALAADDVQIRRSAALILRNCGPQAEDAVPALIQALSDEDDDVRMRAVEALRNVGQDAVPSLCAALNDAQADVRSLAALSLGQIGRKAESAIPQLRESLADANDAVRANVAAALGLIGRVETVPDLIRALVDEHGYVRASGVQALGCIGQNAKSAVHYLRHTLKDEYVEVRRLTAETLGKMGPAAKVAVPELIEALLDADPDVSREAAESLLLIGSEAVPCLIETLRSTDSIIRRTAAYVLGSLGPDAQDAVRPLIVALRDQDATVRETAADALEQIHSPGPAAASAA